MSEETVRFHEVVEQGSLEALKQALKNKEIDVNAPGQVGRRALMVAIAAKDLDKVKLLVSHGADPELTDDFNSTALRYAVSYDLPQVARYLLGLGVDRGYRPKYPLKRINFGRELPEIQLPESLTELMSDKEWNEAIEETKRSILELGQNPKVEPIICDVQSVEILKLFLDAGDDLNLAPTEVKRAYIGLPVAEEFQATLADYSKHKSPRYGSRNAQRMDNPFWRDMIRLGCNTYSPRKHFGDDNPFNRPGVVWCYDRFGSSLTELEDGRFVQIGGEHEDFYDPDFYIYNDVVIHDGKGNFEIYGYPKEIFPPTDFHSATLVENWIYIIGCLGYPEQREEGRTPVYQLKLGSWEISEVNASGEMPSWLSRHCAKYLPEHNTIIVEGGELQVAGEDKDLAPIPNEQRFEFDLSSFEWRKRI